MKEIVIKGSIDELVECEFYLIMVMGYKKNEEDWNNHMASDQRYVDRIITKARGEVEYHFHPSNRYNKTAKQFLSQFK